MPGDSVRRSARWVDEEPGTGGDVELALQGATLFLLAGYVAYESLSELLGAKEAGTSAVGLALAAASLIVMLVFSAAKLRVARAMGSKALRADAMETWVCAYLSAAPLLGLGMNAMFGWWWADAVASLGMLPVIVWQGWETFEDARVEHGDEAL